MSQTKTVEQIQIRPRQERSLLRLLVVASFMPFSINREKFLRLFFLASKRLTAINTGISLLTYLLLEIERLIKPKMAANIIEPIIDQTIGKG